MTDDKKCKLTIYVARPTLFLFGDKRKRRNKNEEDIRQRFAGHSFLGLTDENGNEKRIGFFAKFTVIGEENVPKEDVIKSPKDLLKKVAGILKDETNTKFHEAIEYDISKEQYERAVKFIEDWQEKKQKYVVLANNCVSFAMKTARSIGLRPPLQLLAHIPTPLGMSISINLKEKFDNITVISKKISEKLSKFFGGVGKVIKEHIPNVGIRSKNEDNPAKLSETSGKPSMLSQVKSRYSY